MAELPETIYHYTTAKVLLSIFENNELWASDVLYMNDAQELVYAKEHARKLISKKLDQFSEHADGEVKSRRDILESILHELDQIGSEKYSYSRMYATCFCEDGDLLSQWRAYGQEEGYAIGFRTEVLQGVENPLSGYLPIALKKIHYGLKSASNVFREMTDSLAQNSTGHPGSKGAMEFGDAVLPRLAVVKNPTFKEENEWRMMAGGQGGKSLNFRVSKLGLIPYVKFKLPPNAIAEIRIGPGNNRRLKLDAIRQMVVKYEPSKNLSIGFSESPLRS